MRFILRFKQGGSFQVRSLLLSSNNGMARIIIRGSRLLKNALGGTWRMIAVQEYRIYDQHNHGSGI